MGSADQPAKKLGISPAPSLADALFTQTQQRVLSLIFGQPERAFSISELIDLAGSGSGAVQRELQRLVASKLIVADVVGRHKRYRANAAAPIFEELCTIIKKTVGVPEQLRRSLAPLATRIRFAVLFGSVAKRTDTAASDVDVLVVSDELALDQIFAALEAAERALGRHVSPTLYTSEEFRRRRDAHQPFLSRVLQGDHVMLVGSEDAVAAA
jgi:predicted nucleotidyltransferase